MSNIFFSTERSRAVIEQEIIWRLPDDLVDQANILADDQYALYVFLTENAEEVSSDVIIDEIIETVDMIVTNAGKERD